MMRKKGFVLIVLALVIALCGVMAACGDKESANEPKVEISRTEAALDKWDTLLLTAERTGTDETIVWKSSDTVVATVTDGGLVEALSVGSAEITASAGGASAVCKVTVTDSGAQPVLEANVSSTDLRIGIPVVYSATAKFKNNPIAATDFAWSAEDENVVRVQSNEGDASSATFTGLSIGETDVTVTAVYRGITVSDVIHVRVKEDVTLALGNLAQTDGKYALELFTSTLNNHKMEFVPQVEVTKDGESVSNPQIEWALKEGAATGIVTVADDGTIHSVRQGSTEIEFSWVSPQNVKYTVEVFVKVSYVVLPIAHDGDMEIDLNDVNKLALSGFAETPVSATLGDVGLTVNTDSTDCILTGFDEAAYGPNTLRIYTDTLCYEAEVTAYTKIIRNKTDLSNLAQYCTVTNLGGEMKKYDGYFVLDADIDYENGEFACFSGWGGGGQSALSGFAGTFDGRGHTISNITTRGMSAGMFGWVATNAVIKNIGFVNAHTGGDGGGLLAGYVHGTIENVFIEGVSDASGDSANDKTGLICSRLEGGAIRNCVVFVRGTGKALTSFVANGTVEHVYSIGAAELYDSESYGILSNVGAYATAAALAENADFATFTEDLWDKSGTVPVSKAYKAYVTASIAAKGITNEESSLPIGSVLTVSSDLCALSYTVTSGNGTVNGNMVTVSENAQPNDLFTLKAASQIFPSISVTKTFTVSYKYETMSDVIELDLNGNNSFAFDKTPVRVTLGAVEVGFTYSNGNVSVTDFKTIGFGEYDIYIDTATEYYSGKINVYTKIIRNKTDLSNLAQYCTVTNLEGEKKKYDGYFVLDADIDYENGEFACFAGWGGGGQDATSGFAGMFDGRGHTISNIKTKDMAGGMFGTVSSSGVIKNVAFVNARTGGDGGGLLSGMFFGTMENIFVQGFIDASGDINADRTGFLCGRLEGTMRNCMVVVDEDSVLTSTTIGEVTGFALTAYAHGGTIVNCFAIGKAGEFGNNPYDTSAASWGTFTNHGVYDTAQAFASAVASGNVDISAFTSPIWNVSGDYPVFSTSIED